MSLLFLADCQTNVSLCLFLNANGLKELGAVERIEKQARLCGFLSPCQDPLQLPLLVARSRIRKPRRSRPLLQLRAAGELVGGRSSRPAARYCLGVQRREEDAFENVSSDVSRTDGFPSLPSLCCCAVLQLKLQQRRTREELVSQGIMPREYHLNSFSFCYYACFLSRDWFHK